MPNFNDFSVTLLTEMPSTATSDFLKNDYIQVIQIRVFTA